MQFRAGLAAVARAKIGLDVKWFNADSPEQLKAAFSAISQEHVDALYARYVAFMAAHRLEIAQWAIERRLPSIGLPLCGMLLDYGPDDVDLSRQAARFVKRILEGTPPGELPFEQPRYRLTIDLRTAKAIGLTIPRSLLLRADEVVR
jgi:putative ABC transport system substrate-binding protein